MKSNIYKNILDNLYEINSSIYRLSEIDDEQLSELSISEKNEIINLLDSLEVMTISGFKEIVEESLDNSEWDFEQSGNGIITAKIEYEYIEEDDDCVTYQYFIDGVEVGQTIDISKEHIIDELNEGKELDSIIISEIESNSLCI